MCMPASFIVTRTKVLFLDWCDSHEEIIKHYKLDDSPRGGDKVYPAEGEIVEVFSVFPIIRDFSVSTGSNHFLDECDFSVVYKDPETGEFLIYSFDSRLFELVK